MTQLYVQTLGPHNRVLEAVRRGKPALIKLVDPDKGWVDDLHTASPSTTLIGRIVDDHQGKLTAAEARVFAGRVIDKAHELGGLVKWWEGSNEAIAGGIDDMKRLNDFELTFAEYVQAQGLYALVGGFSTGIPDIIDGETRIVPDLSEWEAFYPAMRVACGVHFHEYWHPGHLDDRWNAYRYQMWWPALPDWAKQKWWLISEFGIDGGLAGDGRKGWQDYVSEPRYLQLMKEYNAGLSKYPKIAAAIYIAGLGVDQSWSGFDIADHGLMSELANGWASSSYKWGTIDTISEPDTEPERPEAGNVRQVNLTGQLKEHSTKRYALRRLQDITTIVVHHTASDAHSNYISAVQAIARFHVTSNQLDQGGAPGIAYHRVIAPDGTIYLTQPLEAKSWHAGNRQVNDDSVAIALMCNCAEHPPTQAQVQALTYEVERLRYVIGRHVEVIPHRQVRTTICPGDSVVALIPQLNERNGTDPVEADDYTRGWNDALSHAIHALSVELEKLRR